MSVTLHWLRTSILSLQLSKRSRVQQVYSESEGHATFSLGTGGKMVNFSPDDSFSVNNGLQELTRGSNE